MARVLDCGLEVSEFELLSRDYVHFRTNTLGICIEYPCLFPSNGLNDIITVHERWFNIKQRNQTKIKIYHAIVGFGISRMFIWYVGSSLVDELVFYFLLMQMFDEHIKTIILNTYFQGKQTFSTWKTGRTHSPCSLFQLFGLALAVIIISKFL